VVFILAPLAMFTGLAMSPAIEGRFSWYPKLFGNRQSARSIHFLVMISCSFFIIMHVSLVVATGIVRNLNRIVMGTDNAGSYTGLYIGIGIILATVVYGIFAHWLSWNKQRELQRLQDAVNGMLWRITIDRFKPQPYYSNKDISPYFWANGKMPDSEVWRELATNNFKESSSK
jgi:methionine sulfoxide reductase catalytic subunit